MFEDLQLNYFVLYSVLVLFYGGILLLSLTVIGIFGLFFSKKQWPRTLLKITLSLLVLSWLIYFCFLISLRTNNIPPVSLDTQLNEQVTVNSTWDTYQNEALGFSIQLPITAKYSSDQLLRVHIIESNNQVAFTLNPNASINELRTWKISFIPISSDEALNEYLKSRYEAGCQVEELLPSKQDGVYDVLIKGTSPDLPDDSRCFINWATVNKYFPEKHVLANWDIGQDSNFFSETDESLDRAMVESFRFIE